MTRFLLAILLAASLPSIAQSLPGSPCLTLSQRQRLADSLATLPVVRQAADAWKGKARKRGLLNALLLAGLSGLGYFTLTR
jgi:hypothetical protein